MKIHPITKQVAPEGYVWKQNLLSREYFLEAEDTPMCCSPSSETYWSM